MFFFNFMAQHEIFGLYMNDYTVCIRLLEILDFRNCSILTLEILQIVEKQEI